MSWTDDRIARLKDLWNAGKTASQIAEILGGITRNAVIGKAHRLGLSGRPSPIRAAQPSQPRPKRPQPARPAAPRTETPRRVAAAVAARAVISAPAPLAPPAANLNGAGLVAARALPRPAIVVPTFDDSDCPGIGLQQLTDRHCRWPLGDPREPGFKFCGRACHAGRPYCSEHAARAYQPANSGRREGDEDRAAAAAGATVVPLRR